MNKKDKKCMNNFISVKSFHFIYCFFQCSIYHCMLLYTLSPFLHVNLYNLAGPYKKAILSLG